MSGAMDEGSRRRAVDAVLRGRSALEDDSTLAVSEQDGVMIADVSGGDYDLVERTKKVRPKTAALLSDMEESFGAGSRVADDADELPPIADDETMAMVRTVLLAADERKARDPVAIRVAKLTYMTSFVVAFTGRSEPQVKAIANLIEERMHEDHNLSPRRTSGKGASGWILQDYGDLMVHIFLPEQREFYDLEGLWKGGEYVDLSLYLKDGSEKDDSKQVDDDDESLDDWVS